jgi:cytochrome c oxidase assembly protein subunit 15
LSYWLIGIIGLEILSGIVLAYFQFPMAMQPTHIALASAVLGLQMQIWFSFPKQAA